VTIPLRDQDRTKWDRRLIARGTRALAAAAQGERLTRFHLEAEIALYHSTAPSWEATPWPRIVEAYAQLLAVAPSPLVRLARWVAMAEAGDAAAALAEVEAAREALDAAHAGWPEWPATLGLLYSRTGQAALAAAAYDRALAFEIPDPVRRFWLRARDAILPVCDSPAIS
jgi:RNA polymerase sigma-70 factor (ECF subfamily)